MYAIPIGLEQRYNLFEPAFLMECLQQREIRSLCCDANGVVAGMALYCSGVD